MRGRRACRQGRPEVFAVHRMIWAARATGEGEKRGHDIHHVQRLIDRAWLELCRPIDDSRHAHAAFVQATLAAA